MDNRRHLGLLGRRFFGGLERCGALRVRGGLSSFRFDATGEGFERFDFRGGLDQERALLAAQSFQLSLHLAELDDRLFGQIAAVVEDSQSKYEQGEHECGSGEGQRDEIDHNANRVSYMWAKVHRKPPGRLENPGARISPSLRPS